MKVDHLSITASDRCNQAVLPNYYLFTQSSRSNVFMLVTSWRHHHYGVSFALPGMYQSKNT